MRLTARLQLVVHGDPLTKNNDDGIFKATELTVPVPFAKIKNDSLYVNPAPIGADS